MGIGRNWCTVVESTRLRYRRAAGCGALALMATVAFAATSEARQSGFILVPWGHNTRG